MYIPSNAQGEGQLNLKYPKMHSLKCAVQTIVACEKL